MDNFSENILLKLRRQYSDVEAVKLANQKIDELILENNEFRKTIKEMGDLIKELTEKADAAINKLAKEKKKWEENKHMVSVDDKITFLNERNKAQQKKVREAVKDMRTFRDKYLNLLAKYNKLKPAEDGKSN